MATTLTEPVIDLQSTTTSKKDKYTSSDMLNKLEYDSSTKKYTVSDDKVDTLVLDATHQFELNKIRETLDNTMNVFSTGSSDSTNPTFGSTTSKGEFDMNGGVTNDSVNGISVAAYAAKTNGETTTTFFDISNALVGPDPIGSVRDTDTTTDTTA